MGFRIFSGSVTIEGGRGRIKPDSLLFVPFALLVACLCYGAVVVMPAGQPRPVVELPRGVRGGRRLVLAAAAFLLPVQLPQVSHPWFSSHSASSGSISQAATKTAWSSVVARGGEEKRQRYILAAAEVSAKEGERGAQSSVDLPDVNGPLWGNGIDPAPEAAEAEEPAAATAVETSSRLSLPVEAGAANRDGDNTGPRRRWPRVRPVDATLALGQRLRGRRPRQGRTAAVANFNLATHQPGDPNSQVYLFIRRTRRDTCCLNLVRCVVPCAHHIIAYVT